MTSEADERVVASVKSLVRTGLKMVWEKTTVEKSVSGEVRESRREGAYPILLKGVRQVHPVPNSISYVHREV